MKTLDPEYDGDDVEERFSNEDDIDESTSSNEEQIKQNKPKSKTPALNAFGRDLTKLAKNGDLDPVIGRSTEIERVIQILCRRTKNNPVLLGEPGVGKKLLLKD